MIDNSGYLLVLRPGSIVSDLCVESEPRQVASIVNFRMRIYDIEKDCWAAGIDGPLFCPKGKNLNLNIESYVQEAKTRNSSKALIDCTMNIYMVYEKMDYLWNLKINAYFKDQTSGKYLAV